MKHVTILGDGGWGTALGLILFRKGCQVRIWGPFPDYIARIRREHVNPLYLPDIPLPEEMIWTSNRAEAMDKADLVILAIPSKYFRGVLETFAGLLPAACPVVSVSKGLDPATHRRLTDVAVELLKPAAIAVLSGPSHAEEVARDVPTAVVLACADPKTAKRLQLVLMSPHFRIYTSDDVIGVELGGALKNIIALAVGASDGIGFGDNTRAALITRGLAEIIRLGGALGARPDTFAGLSGLGDLIVTCTSRWSRNRAVGERLGRGESLDQIVNSMKQVAEGVTTCGIARALAGEHRVRAPITEEVYALLHEGRSPQQAVQALLGRNARSERD
ncbi:MAG: NAD(P)-dependent glycerol-3-phosphate dehydrogenase [Verrucomicrobia bacterium]|nr:NAD(P)-dependent glycerol-3-phosphate dehydrogenase [Verrucomicrobiota bacterium]MBU4247979.1 NAD(P)-dependent glycerol-3-phosphate dehydrogenase [Verrucomicrobiota bacterium]MBU4291851.1 NAD(P)-dependent glycerol-3-phosphate dehydrogenase [Verrucomicrobiota bacterium]MBU4497401.1 NAD(P)-dependent glycerol-3-phosphate dehydrogenase [Verrucomicrobiota bacterium]MCG2681878.1 NAD(P)-dependent glycerol-3-phosphate dehydrogenase [Kiritimatiellia bacterium]